MRADRELAADELALDHLKGDRAASYGGTLLKVLSAHSARGFQPGLIGIADDSVHLKQRFRRIVAFGPPRIVGSVIGVALILAVAMVVLGRESTTADLSRYNGLSPLDTLVSAAANNDISVVRKLLDEGVDVSGTASVPGEKTALAAAAAANQIDTVRFLVTRGAQVNPPDGKSSPALLAAIRNGSLADAEYLLAKGATAEPEALAAAQREDARRQKRIYQVTLPALRGRILDRNGKALGANQLCHDLAISFTNLRLSDSDAIAFVRQQIAIAESLLPGAIAHPTDKAILRHYKNWGAVPLQIAADLSPPQQAAISQLSSHELALVPVSRRFYPNGSLAAHILGYSGRSRKSLIEWLEGGDQLSLENVEGREGLEKSFDEVLSGKPGQRTYTFDAQGKKVSEETTLSPEPGNDIVTTLDLDLQKLCEKTLEENGRPGAIVIVEPKTGEVLAMASWPTFDPNIFLPFVREEKWKALIDDPASPLLNRTFKVGYVPGSVFKIFTGLAAVDSGAVKLDEKIANPKSLAIADITFRDWNSTDLGMLTFREALERGTHTWFFKAGIKTGWKPIADLAREFGFAKKTGLPLSGEFEGVVPTEDDMKKKFPKEWPLKSDGWTANIAIGQGILLVTPVQVAQAMGALANGGTLQHLRLVTAVRNPAGQTVGNYEQPEPQPLDIKPEILAELKEALAGAVSGKHGTGHRAAVDDIQIAGKTGSAQYWSSSKPRTASWFAGFAPADHPTYAFAAVIESDKISGFRDHADGLIGTVLQDLLKSDARPE